MTEKKTIIVTNFLTQTSMIVADSVEDYESYLPDKVETFRFSSKNVDYTFLVNKDLLDGKDRDYFIGALLCMSYHTMVKDTSNEDK